jgi:Na+-driven multidrug efflux pump
MLSAMVIALVSQWMIQFPLAYVLSKHTALGPAGLWWSFPIGNALTALVSICWFARGEWATGRLTEDSQASTRIVEEAIIEEGYR